MSSCKLVMRWIQNTIKSSTFSDASQRSICTISSRCLFRKYKIDAQRPLNEEEEKYDICHIWWHMSDGQSAFKNLCLVVNTLHVHSNIAKEKQILSSDGDSDIATHKDLSATNRAPQIRAHWVYGSFWHFWSEKFWAMGYPRVCLSSAQWPTLYYKS